MSETGIDRRAGLAAGRGDGPDFLCVGAQKAGTQWLYDQLAMHSAFWMPPIKEFHHFDLPGSRLKKARKLLRRATKDPERDQARRAAAHRRPLEDRDIDFLRRFTELPPGVDLERYAALFDAKGESIAGDITPGYSVVEPATIAAIAARFPALKALFIARNPVDRFWSAFNMRLRKGDIGGRTSVKAIQDFARRDGVRRRSSQSVSVRHWREGLPDGQFALFFFDDLVAEPEAFRRSVLTFLGAPPDEAIPLDVDFNRKKKRAKVAMTEEARAAVRVLFAEELKTCATEFDGPAVDWAKAYGL